jgi:hypothetical protein
MAGAKRVAELLRLLLLLLLRLLLLLFVLCLCCVLLLCPCFYFVLRISFGTCTWARAGERARVRHGARVNEAKGAPPERRWVQVEVLRDSTPPELKSHRRAVPAYLPANCVKVHSITELWYTRQGVRVHST